MSGAGTYQIHIHNPHLADEGVESVVRQAVVETLTHFEIPRAELSLALLKDQEMADLHLRYLGLDGPTDVLSFDLSSPDPRRRADDGIVGEVVISVNIARRCAIERGHDPAAEMALYIVHGLLHLLGLDDRRAEEAQRMHTLENDILNTIGLGRIYGE